MMEFSIEGPTIMEDQNIMETLKEVQISMELPMEDQIGNGIADGGSDYNGGEAGINISRRERSGKWWKIARFNCDQTTYIPHTR